MQEIMPKEISNDSMEAAQALENGAKTLAKMIVKAIVRELSHQERNLFTHTDSFEQKGESLVLSVSLAAKLLGVIKNTVYEAAHRGQIPCITWGRRILIPRVTLVKMLEEADNCSS